MEDIFDWLEEDFNIRPEEYVFLVKHRRNKRTRTHNPIYLSGVNRDGSLKFMRGLENAKLITPKDHFYEHIKNRVRLENIHCSIDRMTVAQYCSITCRTNLDLVETVRKETWWDRIKVWFSRKVQYFAGYISIERPMKD